TWFRTAVLSSEIGSSELILKALNEQNSFFQKNEPWKLAFINDLSYIIGSRNEKAQVGSYLRMMNQVSQKGDKWSVNSVKGLSKGLAKAQNTSSQLKEALENINIDSDNAAKEAIESLKKFYQ
ncbi:MAG: dehydrogenase, partial [Sphingobacteriaceae bacterium]